MVDLIKGHGRQAELETHEHIPQLALSPEGDASISHYFISVFCVYIKHDPPKISSGITGQLHQPGQTGQALSVGHDAQKTSARPLADINMADKAASALFIIGPHIKLVHPAADSAGQLVCRRPLYHAFSAAADDLMASGAVKPELDAVLTAAGQELGLVAIAAAIGGLGRADLDIKAADAAQCVGHPLSLEPELFFITEMQEGAAAAFAEGRTFGRHAIRRWGQHLFDAAVGKAAPHLYYLDTQAVAPGRKWYEYRHAVYPGDPHALGGIAVYDGVIYLVLFKTLFHYCLHSSAVISSSSSHERSNRGIPAA